MAHPPRQSNNSVRIIAGEYRSRRLDFPSLEGLRPTADRIRETLFNWLQDSVAGETCLDLFAGSGALGLEALSRNAARVDFVEKNGAAATAIRDNIHRLGTEKGRVFCADALKWISEQGELGYGLVFLDPPFSENSMNSAICELESANVMRDGCLVYIERGIDSDELTLPANWTEIKSKKAGAVRFGLYRAVRNR